MHIVVAGASGFVGQALVPALRQAGHRVDRLVRRPIHATDEITWDPTTGQLAAEAFAAVDAVINLSGENIAGGRWTQRRRAALQRSRLDATRTLVNALARSTPQRRVLLNASATGYYGSRGDELLDERSAAGAGFLAELCRAWESEALLAERSGVRVACLRLGMVLGQGGGALAKLVPLFRLGLGGRLGAGNQWMSWVALDDVVDILVRAVTDERYRGAINVVSPEPVTNRHFTAALAETLHRPATLPVPAFPLRMAFGQMADEALLASARVIPARLVELQYDFKYPSLDAALRAACRS
jgi:uncharacterized protein (TIGR01777 family)